MITIINRSPVSPTIGGSLGHVAYKDIGPRPKCVECGDATDCPECAADAPYKVPVVAGDLVYLQFNLADNLNTDPENPEHGWYDSPTGDYYIRATLEFGGLEPVVLPSLDIVESANVGWANGSYQNLILDSEKIYDYIRSQNVPFDCFRVVIDTFKRQGADFTSVVSFGNALPVGPQQEGSLAAVADELYTYTGGEWILTGSFGVGDFIQYEKNGWFYEWNGTTWMRVDRPYEIVPDATCYTHWHKFVQCDNTILLEGLFGFNDCRGKYYGITEEDANLGLLPYRDLWRIEASFEMRGIVSEKTTNENGIVTQFDQREQWLLRNTTGIPDDIARRLANTLSATQTYINGNEYINASDIVKVTDDNLYWYVAPTIERRLCEKENDCDDVLTFNPVVRCVQPVEITCEEARVVNSSGEYLQYVQSGGTLILEDTTYRVYQDGVLTATETIPSMEDYTINLIW